MKEAKAVTTVQPQDRLTRREYEVLLAVTEGLTTRAITRRLNIKETTVKHHLSNLLNKLGASSRLELVMMARHHQIVESSDLKSSELCGLGFALTINERDLIYRAINGQLREEDMKRARALAGIIGLNRQEMTGRKRVA